MPDVECIWQVGAMLGEGPVWSAAQQAVWFVDIKGQHIHRYHPASGERRSWNAPARVGFVLPTRGGGMIAGLKTGLHRFNPETGNFTLLHVVEPHAPNNRLNDGFVDSAGFLWFGSMDDNEEEPSGALYQLGAEGCLRRDPGYVVTNGPAESPDGRVLYHTDTLAGIIYAFDRARTGTLSNKRVFARLAPATGFPDGPAVDAEGCLWTGLFCGWGLQRYSPDGKLLATLELPVANVTKAAFGDADLRTLYITSAWVGLDEAARKAQPLAGGLFRARVEVPGLPPNLVTHGI
jgi:xylono-1,5-lactonase